eukprot:5016212-Lingulodinium_polyedra.AAC.1
MPRYSGAEARPHQLWKSTPQGPDHDYRLPARGPRDPAHVDLDGAPREHIILAASPAPEVRRGD